MKLFISWSGERSKALALALKEWFPLVLHYADPWLSEADIEAGQRWADAVAKELEACNFGILCVTRENLNSPWVLFEAGALAKSLEGGRVIPLLLDLDFRDISGPLAQFQAKKCEKNGLLETIQSINQSAANPTDERYKQLFEALWPDLDKKISDIPKPSDPVRQTRTQSEVLEELVGTVRTMESRLRESPDEPRQLRRRKRMHPMMLREFSHMFSEKRGDPISILMIASIFREDIPWLYEIGVDAYRHASGGNRSAASKAVHRFLRAIEAVRHSPFIEELDVDDKMIRPSLFRDIEFMLHEEFSDEDRKGEKSLESSPSSRT
ncbi:toll/interleukin-1 receptor domain-containing protein [Dyella nitratireducens]|uniref:TIR domain-containing protein n=1 Tax=Dyella nitratireducens TaxID=1849580 RepID=A0ABQ1FIA1_9GAMM|nr:toll/interleukin-1 receptor domain-containing protein [Dyella nitratireducens]GGA16447.1 hypothetical protein GCM10010981_00090 [Dyella nitratireducens]GLQ44931.1 hypothetical protein GCM10007902_47810 [Dyella nitratireducens]